MNSGGVVRARGQVPGVIWSMGVLDLTLVGVALNAQSWVLLAVMSALGLLMAVIGVSAAVTRYELADDRIRISGGLASSQELAFKEVGRVATFTRPRKNVVFIATDGRQLVLGPRAIRAGPEFLRAALERCRWAEFDPAVLAAYGLEIAPDDAPPVPTA